MSFYFQEIDWFQVTVNNIILVIIIKIVIIKFVIIKVIIIKIV